MFESKNTISQILTFDILQRFIKKNNYCKSIHDNAQAIPKTLCLLDAVREAIPHHQIPVSNHVSGSSQLANANEILRGMLIIATESHAFRFSPRFEGRLINDIII
jgi:hypothetical protein